MAEVENIIKRALLNQRSESLGIRPLGEFNAAGLELKALLEEKLGESPERIEELLSQAEKELLLDREAEKLKPPKNASNN